MNMKESILRQPGAIDGADLKSIVEQIAQSKQVQSLVSNMETDACDDQVEWVVNKKIRDTQEVQLSASTAAQIQSILETSATTLINPFYKVAVRDWEPPQILHYGVGGHYIPHVDSETLYTDDIGLELWEKTLDRDLSVVYFLNDDFVGGDLVFPKLDLVIAPRAGTLVCFPSDHNFIHGVNPVTSGHRYTLVTWLRVSDMLPVEQINRENMETYERAWPQQIEQPPRVAKGGLKRTKEV